MSQTGLAWGYPWSEGVVTKLPPTPQLEHLADGKLPFGDDGAGQQGEYQTLRMAVPCAGSHIECDDISHLFWLGPKDPQTCEDMVGGVHDEVANLHIVVYLEIILQAELHKGLQNPQVIPSQAMLPCPEIYNSLTCCQPPVEVNDWAE